MLDTNRATELSFAHDSVIELDMADGIKTYVGN